MTWKQYSIGQEIKVDRHLVWHIIKLWVKRKTYKLTISFHAKTNSSTSITGAQIEYGNCHCYNCADAMTRMSRMIVCPKCGNKRCPHSTDHNNPCTNSNEAGQEGSRY